MPVVDRLQPGLTPSYIKKVFEKNRLFPPRELIDLYFWRNGTNKEGRCKLGDLWLFPGFYIYSLEEAVIQYFTFRNHSRWNPNWFPVLADDGGDFFVFDFEKFGKPSGHIFHFYIDQDDHPIEYITLTSMMATFYECYKTGIISKGSDGYLEMNYENLPKIAIKHNPGVKFWEQY